MVKKGNADTAVAGLYETWRANFEAQPFEHAHYEALRTAENAMAETPAESLSDLLLKLEVARKQTPMADIYEALVESVYRDLQRMNAPTTLAVAA